MGAEPIPHDVLLRHAGFLRSLARDLVGDSASSEDAVQEVWLRALQNPPRHDSNLRGWLRVLLTNLVRSKARTDSRREIRERDRSLDTTVEPCSTDTRDEGMLRSVTEAVLALEEPLRSTVLQHYFQGLTLREISERERTPVSTVKSRLQRALGILRGRLKREEGDSWRSSLLALTIPKGILQGASKAAVGKGVVLITLKTKIAVACAVVLTAGLVYRGLTSRPMVPPTSAEHVAPVVNASSTALETPLVADSKPFERVPVSEAPTAAPAKAQSKSPKTLFYGELLDPSGEPLRGLWSAWVIITDAEGRRRTCDAKAEGSFAFNAIPFGRYWVSAGADGYEPLDDVLDLDADHAQVQKDLTLQPAPILKIRLATPDGRNLLDVLREQPALQSKFQLVPVATKDSPGKWFTEVVGSLNNSFGIGHFWQFGPRADALPPGCMGILMVDQPLPAFVSLVNFHRVLQTKEVHPGEDEVVFVLAVEDLTASLATVRLRVVDSGTGTPLAGAHATLWAGGRDPGGSSDANGDIVIESCLPGEFDLNVTAKDHAEFRTHILAESGRVTDLGTVVLEKGVPLKVKVVDGAGIPQSARFSLGSFDPGTGKLIMDNTRGLGSAGDGVLNLGVLGRRRYLLRTSNLDAVNDQGNTGPKLVSEGVLLDLRSGNAPENMVVTLAPATRLTVSVKGEPADGLRFVVTDGNGADLVSSRFYGNAPRPLSLRPGKYQVTLLDANKSVLREQSITLGSAPMTIELMR